MLLLVGLGNPGTPYARTRHNAGFLFTAAVAAAYGFPSFKKQFNGLVSKGKIAGQDILLLQPQTFMNLSGQSVQAACTFYKTPPANLWVAHDELDIPQGKVKYKWGGGDAGHNGLKSITGALGANYHRLRLGIGRPTEPLETADYVLQNFTGPEAETMAALIEKLVKQLPDLLENPTHTLAKLGNLEA
jgi:peptidyl-tRNA hydrolase, PTH1 family